jgi:selenocysteine-specific elongation factor
MPRGPHAVPPESLTSRSIVIGTAGHVDHGKSALVRTLTGIDPDRLKEERERGITIDLGFAHCEIDGLNVAFVDVPGHERFVRNMLAGAGGIDAVMLVVAADESVKPQTREHFAICRLLGVRSGFVALTKADLVDEETLELSRLEVAELTAGSFLEGCPIVAVSSVTGHGVQELRQAIRATACGAGVRSVDGPVRLPIDRAFSIRGFGTVVTGTLVSGTIRVDSELTLAPDGRPVKVRGMQVHGGLRRSATAGERVAVNLAGIETAAIGRGDTLVTPGAFEPTRVADAWLEALADVSMVAHGARVRFHHGTSEIIGRVSVAHVVGAGGHAGIPGGASGFVRIRLEAPAVVTRGDRFILRAYSPAATIAGGRVLDPAPPRGAIRTPAALERWTALSDESPIDGIDRGLLEMIEGTGMTGITIGRLASRAGAHMGSVRSFVDRAVEQGRAVAVGDAVLSSNALGLLETRLLRALGAFHEQQPLSEGMPREEARARVFARSVGAVFEQVLSRLRESGVIRAGERIALATHRAAPPPDQGDAMARIERTCREAGLRAPSALALSAAASLDHTLVERIVGLLIREKVLVRISDLLFHEATLARLKAEVQQLKIGGKEELDVGDFKLRYGVTRKYAIPLLEYLDRERITRRRGDRRVIV